MENKYKMQNAKCRLKKLVYACFFLTMVCQMSLMAQCNTEEHSNAAADSWLSCQMAEHPVTGETDKHWIQYDFTYVYALTDSWIWNYNAEGETDRGFREVMIHYSKNGTDWNEWGTFEFEEATGANNYEGNVGPDFGNLECQYLVLTANSSWGHPNCAGLGEVKFNLGVVSGLQPTDIDQALKLTISPNPGNGEMQLSFDGDIYDYQIFDIDGSLVTEEKTSGKTPSLTLDLTDLPRGTYFITANTDRGAFNEKIVLQ